MNLWRRSVMFFGAKGVLKAAKETVSIVPSLLFRKTASWSGRMWLVGGFHRNVKQRDFLLCFQWPQCQWRENSPSLSTRWSSTRRINDLGNNSGAHCNNTWGLPWRMVQEPDKLLLGGFWSGWLGCGQKWVSPTSSIVSSGIVGVGIGERSHRTPPQCFSKLLPLAWRDWFWWWGKLDLDWRDPI